MRRLVIPHRKASVEGPFDRPSVMPFNSPGPIYRTLVGHNFPLHAVFPHPIYRPSLTFVLPTDRSLLRFAAVVRLRSVSMVRSCLLFSAAPPASALSAVLLAPAARRLLLQLQLRQPPCAGRWASLANRPRSVATAFASRMPRSSHI